ncbi:MAG: SAP domain-containing protein [Thermoflexibacter sp.]|jgi:hypothetical protein|nr:SAP domain-containing protein [Thermoflexibacter sp.]
MQRPNIIEIQTGEELKKWYWLKDELVSFAKLTKTNYSGSKFEILERLANQLDGKHQQSDTKSKYVSKFNWAKEKLTLETVITDNYKNGENVRAFFKEHCGQKFAFSISFMAWIKSNVGKTLQDAVTEWQDNQELQKQKDYQSKIPDSNQYNKYTRDFFADNPEKTIQEARHFWKLKRKLPLGKHFYERTDLELKE